MARSSYAASPGRAILRETRLLTVPKCRSGSKTASPVARWRGSYGLDIGLEGLTTGAARVTAGPPTAGWWGLITAQIQVLD